MEIYMFLDPTEEQCDLFMAHEMKKLDDAILEKRVNYILCLYRELLVTLAV
jgi:hypothetical protein